LGPIGTLLDKIETFAEKWKRWRYHGRLNNLNPADVYFDRGQTIPLERVHIKRRPIQRHQNKAEWCSISVTVILIHALSFQSLSFWARASRLYPAGALQRRSAQPTWRHAAAPWRGAA
jgi:hypothetical protein